MKPYFSWYSVATLCLVCVCPATAQTLRSLPHLPLPRQTLPTPGPHATARPTESGYFDTLSVGGRQGRRFRSVGCQMDFAVRGSGCTLRAYFQSEGALLFSVDGQPYAPLAAPALSQWVSVPLFSGLSDSLHRVSLKQVGPPSQVCVDAAAPVVVSGRFPRLFSMPQADPAHWGARQLHEIVITNVGLAGWARLYSVMFPGGALSTLQPAPVRPVLMAFGHSIVAGAILPNLMYVYYQQMAQARGYAIASRGVGGSTFVDFPANPDTRYSTRSGQARLQEIVAVQPELCLIDAFTNDASNQSGADPPETPADLQAALTSALHTLLEQCPRTRFTVLGILDKGKGLDFTAWNAAIAEAVAAQNVPRCVYLSQTGWIDPALDTYDGTHPNIQGSQKIAAHLEPLVFPP